MKKILTLLFFTLQYTAFITSTEVHVVPMYQERLTGRWCGLFAHDAGGLWSTFKQKITNNKDVITCAMQALQEQTNGVYAFDKEKLQKLPSSITLNDGSVVCCFPVKHMTIPMLQKNMVKSVDQNIKKDKFIWVPMEEFLAHTTIVRTARNVTMRYKFDDFTKRVFKNYWESSLLPQLNASVNRDKALQLAAKKTPKIKVAKVARKAPPAVRTAKKTPAKAPIKVVQAAKKPIKPSQPKTALKTAKFERIRPAVKQVKATPASKRAIKVASQKTMRNQKA